MPSGSRRRGGDAAAFDERLDISGVEPDIPSDLVVADPPLGNQPAHETNGHSLVSCGGVATASLLGEPFSDASNLTRRESSVRMRLDEQVPIRLLTLSPHSSSRRDRIIIDPHERQSTAHHIRHQRVELPRPRGLCAERWLGQHTASRHPHKPSDVVRARPPGRQPTDLDWQTREFSNQGSRHRQGVAIDRRSSTISVRVPRACRAEHAVDVEIQRCSNVWLHFTPARQVIALVAVCGRT